jgi:hypothetical protein
MVMAKSILPDKLWEALAPLMRVKALSPRGGRPFKGRH